MYNGLKKFKYKGIHCTTLIVVIINIILLTYEHIVNGVRSVIRFVKRTTAKIRRVVRKLRNNRLLRFRVSSVHRRSFVTSTSSWVDLSAHRHGTEETRLRP